ncbi:hypothetical protein D3C72_1285310 [compost metagenome]
MFDEVVESAAVRVGQHDAHAGLVLFQAARDAGQRAAGAGRAGEGIDMPAGGVPDLGSGGLVVGLAVGQVVELVGPDRVVGLVGQPAGNLLVVVRIGVRLGGHRADLGAEHAQPLHLFGRLRIGYHDDAAVAARRAQVGQADAGIAGGPLDHGTPRLQQPALFGIADDVQRRAVLDRAARIEEFRLAVDIAAGLGAQPRQPDQRGVANGAGESVPDFHDALLPGRGGPS